MPNSIKNATTKVSSNKINFNNLMTTPIKSKILTSCKNQYSSKIQINSTIFKSNILGTNLI